jgi:hypothetical protein
MLFQQLLHGVADVYLVGKDDIAVERAIPVGLPFHVKGIPGEVAVAVSQQQAIYGQVASYGHKTVVLTPAGIGEP